MKLDKFHWHEAIDRAALIANIFERDLLEHPAIQQTPRLKRKAKKLARELYRFYTEISL